MSDYESDFLNDEIDSDDPQMQVILKLSELESHRSPPSARSPENVPSSSTLTLDSHNHHPNSPSKFKPHGTVANLSQTNGAGTRDGNTLALRAKVQTIERRIAGKDAEITSLKRRIQDLNTELDFETSQRRELVKELEDIKSVLNPRTSLSSNLNTSSSVSQKGKGKGKMIGGIDYENGDFAWMSSLKKTMKNVFGIDSFRLCQLGVCNANMDGRDIVVVMPTGGGKSLTYQLPALLTPGCTLVVSPLLSLITDQVLHLQEHRINAVALTGSMRDAERKAIEHQLRSLASGSSQDEIKLCYVTPEKLQKNKSFQKLLQDLANAGKLSRIVIDEAHCVSAMGHDFRPDYAKLHNLRLLLPSVPIMALSATCPPNVREDLLKILKLPAIVDGRNAGREGTVFFSAPLYRKNLHYTVVPKSSSSANMTKVMVDYILEHHPNDTGIVYCLSKKDSEKVAKELQELSDNKIRTGIYHSERPDSEKAKLHNDWREGRIKVVCATIAFGLGIDKGDVRFVLHHSLPKSVEGFYQESGRAGRDGKDADCILYYRPQDVTKLLSMTIGDRHGKDKLHAVLDFASNLRQCRKILFAQYFSHSSSLSISSWTTEDQDALERCGHCDNCKRPYDATESRDVAVQTWQLLKIVQYLHNNDAKITLKSLVDIAKNAGRGAFQVGKGAVRRKERIDLEEVAGGVVELSKIDIEHLIVSLLLKGYLKESFVAGPYTTNVYLIPGPKAPRFIYLSKEELSEVEMLFLKPVPRSRGGKKKREVEDEVEDEEEEDEEPRAIKRRKIIKRAPTNKEKKRIECEEIITSDENSSVEEVGWIRTYRDFPAPKLGQASDDILELSSD